MYQNATVIVVTLFRQQIQTQRNRIGSVAELHTRRCAEVARMNGACIRRIERYFDIHYARLARGTDLWNKLSWWCIIVGYGIVNLKKDENPALLVLSHTFERLYTLNGKQ